MSDPPRRRPPEDPLQDPPVDPLTPPESFLRAAEAYGIAFDDGDLRALGLYLAHLLDANRRFNLTAITDPEQAWERHVLDSLTLLPYVFSSHAERVADVGSGAGLPGMPLAITVPEVQFTLVEATGKKARFIQETAETLGLANVEVIDERAETIGRDERHREAYDLVLARAVGPLPVLVELTVPLARVGGWVLAIKGQRAAREIDDAAQALHLLHAGVAGTVKTPTGTIVIIEKARPTPRAYPRRPGEPRRAPLGRKGG